jgi:hypothetical protein
MKEKKELKIFRKTSIEYLKRMYDESMCYVLDKNTWKSTDADTYGKSRILLRTRKSLKKLGGELKIFKAPSIVGLKIMYYKSMGFVFDKYASEHRLATFGEENYLLRDLPASADYFNDMELKIFKLPTVEKLESMYYKSIGKVS